MAGVTVSSGARFSLSLDRGRGGLTARQNTGDGSERTWQVLGASRGEGGILGEGVRQALLRDPTYGPALEAARCSVRNECRDRGRRESRSRVCSDARRRRSGRRPHRARGRLHAASRVRRIREDRAGCGAADDATTVWFGDERCVPPDDDRSNYKMAKEALLDPLGDSAPRGSFGFEASSERTRRQRTMSASCERLGLPSSICCCSALGPTRTRSRCFPTRRRCPSARGSGPGVPKPGTSRSSLGSRSRSRHSRSRATWCSSSRVLRRWVRLLPRSAPMSRPAARSLLDGRLVRRSRHRAARSSRSGTPVTTLGHRRRPRRHQARRRPAASRALGDSQIQPTDA